MKICVTCSKSYSKDFVRLRCVTTLSKDCSVQTKTASQWNMNQLPQESLQKKHFAIFYLKTKTYQSPSWWWWQLFLFQRKKWGQPATKLLHVNLFQHIWLHLWCQCQKDHLWLARDGWSTNWKSEWLFHQLQHWVIRFVDLERVRELKIPRKTVFHKMDERVTTMIEFF